MHLNVNVRIRESIRKGVQSSLPKKLCSFGICVLGADSVGAHKLGVIHKQIVHVQIERTQQEVYTAVTPSVAEGV